MEFEVESECLSTPEDESENFSALVAEIIAAEMIERLYGILTITDDEELSDWDFDDSAGSNSKAKSEIVEAGRNALTIKDENDEILWSDNSPVLTVAPTLAE